MITVPFVVICDTREQRPYEFAGLHADAAQGGRALNVTVERGTLRQGDYSIRGQESKIAVERKSPEDLFGTLGQGRARFVKELERLNEMDCARVVVEADWWEILAEPPAFTKLLPKTIHRSVIAWQHRYPAVHWWFVRNRRLGEITTFRILERYWKELGK